MPATAANLGPGFDTLGMALSLFNYVEMEEIAASAVKVEVRGEGKGSLPEDANNAVVRAAEAVFERAGYHPPGLRVVLDNRIPVARGLGSSAAAYVGGILGANALCGQKLTREELVQLAAEMDGHPDNAAAAMMGGIVVTGIIRGRVCWQKIIPPPGLEVIIAVPSFELSTSQACAALPPVVPRPDAVYNLQRACLLTLCLARGDCEALGELLGELMDDRLHQPYRASLVPGFYEVLEAARQAGARGAALSGAGPAVLALVYKADAESKKSIGEAMRQAFARYRVGCRIECLTLCEEGSQVLLDEAGG